MIEGASQISSIARAKLPTPRAVSAPGRAIVPVILRVTEAEAAGAVMRIGGLRVVDRAIRLLARLRDARVVVATDGSVPLPRRLPANIERRELEGDAAAGLAALEEELGPETDIVGADTVWLQPGRFDRGIRVTDGPSRAAAGALVFADVEQSAVGIIDRIVNRRIALVLARILFVNLPITPALLTLFGGFLGVYGALMVATGAPPHLLMGFALLQGYVLLEDSAAVLARLRLYRGRAATWLGTVMGDFVDVVLILAVGRALWGHGGTFLDMKMAAAGALMTLFFAAVTYREVVRQGESDVTKLRWWFAYGQSLRTASGAGSGSIKLVTLLGRRDFVIAAALGLVAFDQFWVVLLLLLIVAISRAGAALVQLLTPAWRIPPQA